MLALAACTSSPPRVAPTPTRPDPTFTTSPDRWLRLTDAPTARLEVAAAVAEGGQIFVAGGLLGDGGVTDVVEVYDPGVNTWRRGPSLPEPVHHAMGVALEDDFVVIGGLRGDGSASDRVWRLADGAWQELPPLGNARGAGGAAVVRDEIVVVGGQGGGRLVAATEIFDGERWRTGRPIPSPRDHLGVASSGGFVYAVAGRELSISSAVRALERYDVARDRWRRLPPPRFARGGLGVGVVEGMLIVLGGEGEEADGANAEGVFRQIERYDVVAGEWARLEIEMASPRHGVGAVVIGDAMYVAVGGPQRGGSVSAVLEVLKLRAGLALL